MFQEFPYSDMHQLNLDWIIKIAKDFLDQYTHIQQLISDGEESLQNLTEEGLTQLQDKADALEALLQEWYNTHSDDIADQLAAALADLNAWYTLHEHYLDQTLVDNINAFITAANNAALTAIASIPADYTELSNSVTALENNNEFFINTLPTILKYLKTENAFIDRNTHQESENVLFDIYSVTIAPKSIVFVTWQENNKFWGNSDTSLNAAGVFMKLSGTTYTNLIPTTQDAFYAWNDAYYKGIFYNNTDSSWDLIINCMKEKADTVRIYNMYSDVQYIDNVAAIPFNTELAGELSFNFVNSNLRFRYTHADGTKTAIFPVHAGDILKFKDKVPSWGSFCNFLNKETGTLTDNRTYSVYTVPAEGCISVPIKPDGTILAYYYPIKSIMLDYDNVISNYVGIPGVAFGTSMTARAEEDHKYDFTTYGYLTYLRQYSKMIFDNQGLGNSTILTAADHPDLLAAIKAYTGYSNADIYILEGFVNDWYVSNPLGHWYDTAETTVCGCVRSALNYIMSQNANAKVFLVLDHYGQNYNNVNCASTTKNNDNLTQYEYYEEIAKVAESLGIPVIKEYELSGMSENTPQYFIDNMHLTTNGSQQSAKTIWSVMRLYYPNVK